MVSKSSSFDSTTDFSPSSNPLPLSVLILQVLSSIPVYSMRLRPIGNFPAVQQPFDHGLGNPGRAPAVLLVQALLGNFEVDDADAGRIIREQADTFPADLPAQVRRVPDEGLAPAQIASGRLAGL